MRFFSRKKRDQDLDDEIQSHLRLAAQDSIDRGLTADEAEAAARRELGNADLIKEVTRSTWGWTWLERLIQDLRFAARTLRKDAGFTTVAVLTLALGVGANTAIFSVFHGVLLEPLAYQDPGQLYSIRTSELGQVSGGSGPDFADIHDQAKSFDHVGAALPFSWVFVLRGEPKRVRPTAISPGIFPMLGVRPLLGREYLPEEYHVDEGQIILSYDFWQREFGGDPGIIGRTISENYSMTVVGVMPRLPDFYPQTDVWAKLDPDFEFMKWRGNRFLQMYGRLKHGVSKAQAEQELTAILRRNPETPTGLTVALSPLRDALVGKARPILLLLMAAVGLVLLIASVNVATLLLARGETRAHEMDLRITLGAGRWRLLQQLFTENLTLALLGGLAGTALAVGLTRLLLRIGSEDLPRNQNIVIDSYVLGFTLFITVATSILFGLAPSMALVRNHRVASLGGGSRATRSLRRPRRNFLIVSEVGLSLVLIIASGLLLRSLWKLVHTHLGFQPERLFATFMRLPNEDPTVAGFYQRLLSELPELPGVEAAAVSDCVPGIQAAAASLSFSDRATDPAHLPTASGCWISADYFRATGTPLISGRFFTEHDNMNNMPVAIINQSLARRYWPDQEPIGKFLAVGYLGAGRRPEGSEKPRQIVGVVTDVNRLGERGESLVYMPFTQDETKHVLWAMILYVKSRGASDVTAPVKAKLHSLRPDLPVTMASMEAKLSQTLAPRRFTLLLLSGFALLALVLAAVGIHGVVAYSVSRRTREIGVRMALGARRGSVVNMMIEEVLRPLGAGVILGAVAALACSRFIAGMLYGTRPAEPVVLISCSAIMLAVAVVAAWLPARRAASIDPMEALRTE